MSNAANRHRQNAAKVSRRLLSGSSLAALALLALASSAHAEDRNWDANGTAIGTGGAGTWNLDNLNWSPSADGVSGPYSLPWSNAAFDNAIFGGTAGTVTLGAPIVVHNLTFNAAGFTLTGSTLTLSGLSPTITTNSGNTTINSVIAGSSGLTKAGAGGLILNGTNSFTGDILLNLGSIYAGSDAALGNADNNISTAAAATVRLSIAGAATSRSVTIGDAGTLILEGAGAGSALITGNGRVSVAANGVTMSNDASTYTGQTIFAGCNGVCSTRFTSIGDLGVASSLGAPVTVADGTIVFNQQSQYSDSIIYLGDGDSSNRNWDINGNGAIIRNQGTGTLTITGDVDVSVGSSFYAETADFELFGILSGGAYAFNGAGGNVVTLGGANTFSGAASIGGLVRASVLADIGAVSSLGTGTNITLSTGSLSYTGTGNSSNRVWIANGAGGILNDGTGALNLSGSGTFAIGGAADSLTLGGTFAGENSFLGTISGAGNLIGNGAGTWVLGGANDFTGSVTVNAGTLKAGSSSAFGAATGFIVNGGTLDLDGYDLTAPSLSGTGGAVALGSANLTIDTATNVGYAGLITGGGGLTKAGNGILTLSGTNTYTGTTTVNGGTLALGFNSPGAPLTDIISSASTLNLAGGTVTVLGGTGQDNVQTFNGLNILAGTNRISAQSGATGSTTLNFGAVNRVGGLIDFVLPATGNFTTSNTSLGGWATINGTDYAKVVGGDIVAFTEADYTDQDDASLWADGQYISDSDGDTESFSGTVASDVQLAGLQFTTSDATTTVTVAPTATLGIDGTIIVAPSVGANNQTITGGFLTGGTGSSTLGVQQNGGGIFTIASTIVNNGGATSFAKNGSGTVRLTGLNSYTGGTTLSGGRLEVTSLANGGVNSSIGASSADPANLRLESGTLAYIGGSDAVSDRGITLVNGGSERAIQVDGGRTVEFSGMVTSPDDAGLTKTGWGTLVLSNTANDYVGVTTITGGGGAQNSTLSVSTLSNGGVASGMGAATSASANLVMSDGGRLQYTGGTTAIDRGFTLGSGNGGINVAQASATLTVSGIATGAGTFVKDGDGTLILSGANTYAGDNIVNAGTLRAGSAQAFGPGGRYMTVNSGATLELGGFDILVGALIGAGTVDLGANTLTSAGGPGVFSGKITGSGGFTRGGGGYTQTITGCANDYTGVTTISSGLAIDCIANGGQTSSIGASSAASSNLSFAGGTLVYTGASVSTDRGFAMTGNGVLNVFDAGTTLEFSGDVTGTGQLSKDGAGTLLLSGMNNTSGNTRVINGTLRAGSTTALRSGFMSLNDTVGVSLDLDGYDNSVLYLIGGGATGGNITLGTATLTINTGGSASAVYGGAISGGGGLIKNGGSFQQLSGCSSSYSGTTIINAGTLAVDCLSDGGANSSIGSSSSAASNLVINGGALRYVGTGGSTNRQFTLGASAASRLESWGTGAIAFTHAGPLTFSSANTAQTLTLGGANTADNTLAAQITNNGSGLTRLTKTDAGTWILTNPGSTYTGITTISGGVLGVDKLADGGLASSLGASSAAAANLVIGNGSTLRYTGAGDTTNRLFTLSSGVTFIESSGTGAVVFTDTGPVTLANTNQARTIALGGTNAGNNTLAGSIGNAGTGVTTLAKNDSGTWVLTGNHSYTGSTNINAGLLSIGSGGTTGSIASAIVNNFGTLAFNRSDSLTYAGSIVGTGALQQNGAGTTILTGDSSYTGGTTISVGTLQLGNGGTTGSIIGDVVDNGLLTFNRSNDLAFTGVISGSGSVTQDGAGTTTLAGINSYAGGTTINAGILKVSADANLGAASGALTFNGGTLQTAASFASTRNAALAGGGTILTDAGTTFTLSGLISGAGSLTKSGAGRLVLTADNSYSGGTAIAAGQLQLGNGGNTGWITGNVLNNGSLVFNRSDDIGFGDLISGTGSVVQNGAGIVTLTENNSYLGSTTINAGTLLINGDQSAATGLVAVSSGATLGGSGIIGGDVNVVDGGILAPGNSPGTMAINGNLLLSSGSVLNFEFGQADVAGGPLNDLVNVGGDLRLDGTINVDVSAGGAFGGGIYRVFNYDGALTDNGLTLGTMPFGSDVSVQTSVAGQVNLINAAGLALNFWDGDAGPKLNDLVDGGDGIWHVGGVDKNWTNADGSVNAAYDDGTFAIFAGTGGTVTIDNGGGVVTAAGMQFASDGYLITGAPVTLIGPESMVRVGDGTGAGAAFTATIAADVVGATKLVKTDAGTLVLTGNNSYTGGTLISGGVLSVANDSFLGDLAGAVTIDGGTLRLTGASAPNLRIFNLGANGGAIDITNAAASFGVLNALTGDGALTKLGAGSLTLGGDNGYTGGTTILAGELRIGTGGITGSIVGDVLNNGTLTFNRSNAYSYAGSITGTGALSVVGTGVTTLTGNSSYGGTTSVTGLNGELRIAGGATVASGGATTLTRSALSVDGANSVFSTTSLSGLGSLGGSTSVSVTDGGTLRTTGGDFSLRALPSLSAELSIAGPNSLVDVAGGLRGGAVGNSPFSMNISAGSALRTAGASQIGTATSTNPLEVTITGTDSNWTSTGSLLMTAGSFSLDEGGGAGFSNATFGSGLTLATVTVTGVGSLLTTTDNIVIGSGTGTGILTLTEGGTADVAGSLVLADAATATGTLNIGAAAGDPAAVAGLLTGAITFGPGAGTLNFNHTDTAYDLDSAMSGAGTINQVAGVTSLTGDSSGFAGATAISGGSLYVNNVLGGNVAVATAGTLGGMGVIGGNVTVADGAALNPGALGTAPEALTINGNLHLATNSVLNVSLGQANVVGGPLNDLVNVGGNLTLDGTLNVEAAVGGSFDPGVYRVINYTGALTDNGLVIGTIPSPDFYVQTSVTNQVNLVNTSGLTFRYWDGTGAKNDGVIDGGNGSWQHSTGNDNWVDDGSIPNAPFADSAFAVFMGAAGNVTVDGSLGTVDAAGMQFLTDGYTISGDAITLTGTQAVIRVGDGTAAGVNTSARINSELTGAAQLVKSDLGTLILSGNNSYTGGTAVNGGILQISADANLGGATSGLSFNGGTLQTTTDLAIGRAIDLVGAGTLLTDAGTTLDLTGAVSGAGGLTKDGAGSLILSGANSYAGGTTVNAGTLFVNGDQSAASGLTRIAFGATLSGLGVIGGDVEVADGATLDPGGVDGLPGTLTVGGSLSLASGSTLSMQFGEANAVGSALNDLIEVGGDLVLDGTLDVSVPAGGTFGPGIYRVINYGGALTNNGLNLGMMPSGTSSVQTSVAGQVNLVNTDGLALNFWDGNAGPKFNNAVNGGDGEWQSGTGNDNWTDADGVVNAAYSDGAFAIFAGTGGNVTIDNSLGAVNASGMQVAADGYVIGGETLTLVGPQSTIRVGDGSVAGAAFTATIAADVTGNTQLVKTDAGTLVLSGSNSYTGGTAIEGGTLAVSGDANLGDATGGLTFNAGTLQTTADFASDRAVSFTGDGMLLTDQGTTFTLNGALSGSGSLTKGGAGTLLLTGDNSGYVAATQVAGGTLGVDGLLGSLVTVAEAGRLEGIGRVGGISNAGVVAPGRGGIGTLTVAGGYAGNGGTLEIEAVLADDSSATDRLVVNGATSGNTQVSVINRDGLGAQTSEGIKIVDVAGASNGTFTLNGDYVFNGEQAVIAGAYGYRMYQGGVASPADGDWYLRSSLLNPGEPVDPDLPTPPLYQPGVPIYEAYGANLQALNGLPTLQQRVGNRSWAAGAKAEGSGIWGRMEGTRSRPNPVVSTSMSDQNVNSWKMQLGADRVLAATDKGERLVAGVTAFYGEANSHMRSIFGNGSLKTDGYGLGATLTWYGLNGFYIDGQAQRSWYDSDLDSSILGELVKGNDGSGEAFSVEVGKRSPVGGKLSVTPQIQMAYSNVRFDRFADPASAVISADKGDSLKSRWGISLDHQNEWDGGRSHIYGLVNLSYEWLDGTRTRVSGTPVDYANERLWGELGLGASVSWAKGVTLFGEVSGNSPFKDFGDSYTLKANAGVRVAF